MSERKTRRVDEQVPKEAEHAATPATIDEAPLPPTPPMPAAPRKPAPPGSHYETLGVPFDASEGELRHAYHNLMLVHHPDHGGTEKAAQSIIEAHYVLSNPELRSRYNSGLNEHHPERYKIGYPATPGVFQFTNDLRLVRMARNRGLPIEDRRPGEPGGEFDRSIVCRWKVTVPPNRKFTGLTRRDIFLNDFKEGVLYTDDPDCIAYYKDMDYIVEDRGHFDNLPDSEFNTVGVQQRGGVGRDGMIYPVVIHDRVGGLGE